MAHTTLRQVINILSIIGAAYAFPTYAASDIGSISEMQGGGEIQRNASTLPAAAKSSIEKLDTVSTNSQGKVKITFEDKTTVNITENSKLVIDDFVYDGNNASKSKLGLKVALGTVRYASGALGHSNPDGVNIATPTATIGVRGTDFVMSVDEIGRTTVILVPNCFDDRDVTKINFNCPNGQISVSTGSGTVIMNKPFQATVVESSFAPPSPPVPVNTAVKAMNNNNIQIASLNTDDGKNLLMMARESIKKYTSPGQRQADDNKDPVSDDLEQVSVAILPRQATLSKLEKIYIDINGGLPKKTVYTNVSPTFRKQIQSGWVYARMSDDKNQLAIVYTPKDSTAQIVSSQNGIIDAYNYSDAKWTTSGMGRPNGHITIIQNGAPPR
jgi:hypothetical protein